MARLTAMTPDEARFLQEYLRGQGFYTGDVNGIWDARSMQALQRYQGSQRIGTSGQLDQATRANIGRRIGAYAGVGNDDAIATWVAENYGPGMVAFLSHPELGPLLRQAADSSWDEAVFEGHLQQTRWYQENGERARQWEIDNADDPAEANARRRQTEAHLYDLVTNMGLRLDPRIFRDIAEDTLRFGWDDTELRDVVTAFVKFDPNNPEPMGSIGVNVADIKAEAARYFIDLTDQEAFDLAGRIERQETTVDAVVTLFRQRAKARYSSLAPMIDDGIVPEDYFAEHQSAVARTLGLGREQVDFIRDPKWMQVTQFVDSKGNTRPMTVQEAINLARHDDRFENTDLGNQEGAQFGVRLAQELGLMAR